MFDIGWSEMAIIMLLALIIIGPKDLPRVARTIGQWVRKGRSLAREFQTSLEDMARDTELDDVRKEIEKVGRTDFKKSIENAIDPKGELTKAFDTSAEKSDTKPKPEPALTDQTGPSANGHVNGTGAASSSGERAPGKIASPAAETDPASAASRTAAVKTTAAKAESTTKSVEPAARAKKPAAKTAAAKKTSAKNTTAKPAAAKKPAPAAKRSAKPAVSTSASKAKAGAAKRGADPSPADEGGGSTDPAAVVVKSS